VPRWFASDQIARWQRGDLGSPSAYGKLPSVALSCVVLGLGVGDRVSSSGCKVVMTVNESSLI